MHRLQTAALGSVRVFPFASERQGEGEGVALVAGKPEERSAELPAPLLRVHSRCLYGEVFQSRDCDCLAQYQEAVRLILQDKCGILCYLDQEGRSEGLINKALAYEYMQQNDADTVEAYSGLHYEIDGRNYSHVADLLDGLGIRRVRLITNNPRKVLALEECGISVDRVPAVSGINQWNIRYINTKVKKMGHLIDVDPVDEAVRWAETMNNNGDTKVSGIGRAQRHVRDFSDLNVVVLGGLVMDVFIRTSDLPGWGHAIQTQSLDFHPGGKGLNQAIAAARLGAKVTVLGAVGQDDFGHQILETLDNHGVNRSGVDVLPKATSPVTIVFSRPDGETSFVGWKNSETVRIDGAFVRRHEDILREADILLATLEVSSDAIASALQITSQGDCMNILNPAPPLERPANSVADLHLDLVDVLIPNEFEARQLAGKKGASNNSVRDVARFLGDVGAKTVCITRAHHGCALYRNGRYREYDAYQTVAHDTAGASDAFCATLALHMGAGYETEDAIYLAHAAGAYSVTKMGAMQSMPTLRQLRNHERFLDREEGA